MSLFYLACIFFYIGLFTIGGGMVAITLMQQTIVAKGLISTEQFYNMVAISESTPGPLGTNMATYIGYTLYGVHGGIIATLAEVLPSIIIIIVIAHFLKKFNQNVYVKGALAFLRPITTGLILGPAIHIFVFAIVNVPESIQVLSTVEGWIGLFNWIDLAAYSLFVFLLLKYKLHPIILLGLGAILGIIFH